MLEQVDALLSSALVELESGPMDSAWLRDFEVRVLGKKGALTLLLRETGKLPDADRPAFGARVNAAKVEVQLRLEDRQRNARNAELSHSLAKETLDVTLPGRPMRAGSVHPLSRMQAEICAVFQKLGFSVESG